jgi:hypothetical protein
MGNTSSSNKNNLKEKLIEIYKAKNNLPEIIENDSTSYLSVDYDGQLIDDYYIKQ